MSSSHYRGSQLNSSLTLGPSMYTHHITYRIMEAGRETTLHLRNIYTKQYSDTEDGSSGGGGGGTANTFNMNDEDEHQFMHGDHVEDHVIDDGVHVHRMNR